MAICTAQFSDNFKKSMPPSNNSALSTKSVIYSLGKCLRDMSYGVEFKGEKKGLSENSFYRSVGVNDES